MTSFTLFMIVNIKDLCCDVIVITCNSGSISRSVNLSNNLEARFGITIAALPSGKGRLLHNL